MNAKQKSALSKIFGVAGAVLLWAPILFMFLTAIVGSIARKMLLFDYLMLAELFPLVAFGLVLLVLCSLMTHLYRKWFGWGALAALVALSAGQVFATVSGLASGALVEHGIVFAIVIATIVVYDLVIVALAILAIVLIKQLFQKRMQENASSQDETAK